LNGQNNVKNTVFVLDLQDRAASNLSFGWRTSPSHMPTARGSFATGTIRSRIYTFGGEGNSENESGVFDQVEMYDTVTDNWKSVGNMRIPRHGMTAVGVGGRVYVPGGGLRQGGRGEQGVADFDAFAPHPIEGYS
jgi:N-acetylneuraminic acid mutarotase